MKFISIKPISKRWINTIRVQIGQLEELDNATCWREINGDPIKLARIKRKALNGYKKDGNDNGEIYFNIIYNDLYDITKFRDREYIKNYLLKHLDPVKDQEIYDYIIKKF